MPMMRQERPSWATPHLAQRLIFRARRHARMEQARPAHASDSSRLIGGAGHLGRHRVLDGPQDAAARPQLGDAHLAQLRVAQQRQHVRPEARPAEGALELPQAVGRQPRAQGGVLGAAGRLLQRRLAR